jgi:hypothetical protein
MEKFSKILSVKELIHDQQRYICFDDLLTMYKVDPPSCMLIINDLLAEQASKKPTGKFAKNAKKLLKNG